MGAQSANETTQAARTTRRRKILIVDDDTALLKAMYMRLRANDYDIVTATDGYSALALARKESPDLILLDLGLPAGDGFSVLKKFGQFPALAAIPVIVLTARDPQANEMRSLDAGAVAFFQKPADNEELLGVVRMCLDQGQALGGRLS